MNETEWLDSLLDDESNASLDEIANAISKLQSADTRYYPAIFSPVQVATDCYWSDNSLWDIWHCHYYAIANKFSLTESATFWHIIETLPSHSICRELVWAVFHSAIRNGNLDNVFCTVPTCIENGKWNGCRSAIYALQQLCNLNDNGYLRFGDAIMRFLLSREGEEQQALAIIAVSIVLCNLSGETSPKPTGRSHTDIANSTYASLLRAIALQMFPCLKSTSSKLLNSLFGLDIKKREKELADSLETGRILKSNGTSYALALSVIDALGMELPTRFITHLAERSLLYADKSLSWGRNCEESSASIHIANLLSKTSTPSETWDSVNTAWRPAIRRRLLSRPDNGSCGTYFALITTFVTICYHLADLWAGKNQKLALSVWHEAWKAGCTALRGYDSSLLLSRNMEKLAAMFRKIRPHSMSQSEEKALIVLLPCTMPESSRYMYSRDTCIALFNGNSKVSGKK